MENDAKYDYRNRYYDRIVLMSSSRSNSKPSHNIKQNAVHTQRKKNWSQLKTLGHRCQLLIPNVFCLLAIHDHRKNEIENLKESKCDAHGRDRNQVLFQRIIKRIRAIFVKVRIRIQWNANILHTIGLIVTARWRDLAKEPMPGIRSVTATAHQILLYFMDCLVSIRIS